MPNRHVVIAKRRENRTCSVRELLNSLDRHYLTSKRRKYCRRVSGPRPDLEYSFRSPQVQCLGHERDDVGLRDCLAGRDRQRGVFIRELTEFGGQEPFPGDCAHRVKHRFRADPPCVYLFFDHPPAQFSEFPVEPVVVDLPVA